MNEHREGYLFGRKCEGRASDPSDIRLKELQTIAARYGLSTGGLKDVLCKRIREYLREHETSHQEAPQQEASQQAASEVVAKKVLKKLILKKKRVSPIKNIIDESIQDIIDDYRNKINLTPEEVDFFISTIDLHDNTVHMTDIVNRELAKYNITDPSKITEYKYSALVRELSDKFCRCIKKTREAQGEQYSIPICRKGVINNRGLNIHRFQCMNKETNKYAPRFLPTKDNEEILGIHPAFEQ
jgi:hypothetical protein